jgi:hypothetical protein
VTLRPSGRIVFIGSLGCSLLMLLVAELSTIAATLPVSGFIPARVGTTATYQYEATQSGTTGNVSVHTSFAITRTAADEISLALQAPDGQRVTREALIGDDGSLQPFAPRNSPTPAPSATPTETPRRKPIPTITDSPVPRARTELPGIPEAVLELAPMLAAAGAEGAYPRTWTHALSASDVPFVMSLSRSDTGPVTILVADGGGAGNAIHLEATAHDGKFVSARGSFRVVTSNMDQTKTATVIWSITQVAGS